MFAKIVFPIVSVLFILYVVVSVLGSGANALSEAMVYMAVFGMIVGLLNARLGIIVVFLCGNYLDFLKRFIVVSGSFNFGDVIKILAVAPIAMTGVYAGLVIGYSRNQNGPFPVYRLIMVALMGAAVVASSMAGKMTPGALLQSAANSALYIGLIAFAGAVYPTMEKQHSILRVLLLMFLPVIGYGWVQLMEGYNRIEVRYALSGMSTILHPLMNPATTEYKRVFSTMNSSVAYTLVGTMLSLYALLFGFGKSVMGRSLGIVFALVCLASHIPGAGRTGWAIAIIAYFAYFTFKNKIATIGVYSFSFVAVLLFLLNAEAIGTKLVEMTEGVGQSEFQRRAITMGTFTERTKGITEVFTHGRYFSLFGLPGGIREESGSHDMIGQIYVTTGAVGLFLTICGGLYAAYYLHNGIWRLRVPERKQLAAFYMANVFAVILAGVFSGSSLHVFPVNIYFWLMAGLLFQLLEDEKRERVEARQAIRVAAEESRGAEPLGVGGGGELRVGG